MSWSIYVLICPIENIVRYVGITERTPEKRLIEHIEGGNKGNTHKNNWIKRLKKQNLVPKATLVGKDLIKKDACEKEIELIKLYRYLLGNKLTNIHEGGNIPPKNKKGTKKKNTIKMAEAARKRFERPEERKHLSRIRKERGLAKGKNNPMFGKKRPEVGKRNQELKSKRVGKFFKGKLIESYPSCNSASLANKLDRGNIGKCCYNSKKTAGGFYWKYL